MKKDNMPEVRFESFSEEWEARKLGDVAGIYDGTHQTPIYQNHGVMFLSVENINDLKSNKYISMESFEAGFKVFPEKGDILMTRIGDIGTVNIVTCEEKIAYYVSLALLKPKKVKSDFLSTSISSSSVKKELWNRTLHIAFPKKINKNEIEKVIISIPSMKEQTQIGNFFWQMDTIISSHQRELDNLKQAKKGFLQKMFPKEGETVPEIRFSGFVGEWKEQKLESLVDRVKSYSLSRDVETSKYTGYKYVHYGDIHTKVAHVIDENSNLPNIKVGTYELLKKGDLVLADASEDYQGIATPAVVTIDTTYKLVAGLHTIALRPNNTSSLFIYYLFNSSIFKKYGYKAGTGMKVFGISFTNLVKFESPIPSLEEQIQIGNFFKHLDDTIALHQRELEALKQTKRAFLQKMFV